MLWFGLAARGLAPHYLLHCRRRRLLRLHRLHRLHPLLNHSHRRRLVRCLKLLCLDPGVTDLLGDLPRDLLPQIRSLALRGQPKPAEEI